MESNLKEKIDQLKENLDKYSRHIGSPQFDNRIEDVQEYFQLTRTDIESLTSEKCAEIILEIQLQCGYWQKQQSRYRAIIIYLESELNRGLGQYSREFVGYHEKGEKLALIVQNSSYLEKVNEYLIEYRCRLSDNYNNVEVSKNICDAIKGVSYSKRANIENRHF